MMKYKYSICRYIVAFLLPIGVCTVVWSILGISPFGKESLLDMDLWGQYFPMYIEQRESTWNRLFHSWNGGLGFNSFVQNAYYCGSVFNPIFRLISPVKMIPLLDLFCMLKFGLCSVSCLYYIENHCKKYDSIMVIGALIYSLSAYPIAFVTQCMWTDSLIILPLLLAGLDRLRRGDSPLQFVLFLVISIFVNFYISFSICIFLLIYFLCEEAVEFESFKKSFKSLLQFALYSSISAGICAVVIFPVLSAINKTAASQIAFDDTFRFYRTFPELLREMLPDTKLHVGYDSANIACGVSVFLLVPLYFLNAMISVRERISYFLMTAFLFISLNFSPLDYFWHGFHFPNQLCGRWSFILVLVLVLMSVRGISFREGITLKRVIASILIGTALLLTAVVFTVNVKLYYILFYIAVIIILGILLIVTIGTASRRFRIVAASIFSTGCIISTAVPFILTAVRDTHTYSKATYNDFIQTYSECADDVNGINSSHLRSEFNYPYTFNAGMLSGLSSVGYYSSTMQGSVYDLMYSLGNSVYAENVSTVYNFQSPVQNALLGIGYFVDLYHNMDKRLPDADIVASTEKYDILQNSQALPIAFTVPGDLHTSDAFESNYSIYNQNILLNTLLGRDENVFRELEKTSVSFDNAVGKESRNWQNSTYFSADTSQPSFIDYTFLCEYDGPVFLESNFRNGVITYECGDISDAFDASSERFRYIGEFSKGDIITVSAGSEGISVGTLGMNLYSLDAERWQSCCDELQRGAILLDSFGDTQISGMLSGGSCFTSISQDGGWTVLCDGKPLKTYTAFSALLAFDVPDGTHSITMRYHVPLLREGLIVSVVMLFVFIIMLLLRRKRMANTCREEI